MYFVAFLYSVLHGSIVWRYVFRKNVRFKGAFVASHSVVGCSSLVTGSLSYPNSIYAGIPAKRVKCGIYWGRGIETIN